MGLGVIPGWWVWGALLVLALLQVKESSCRDCKYETKECSDGYEEVYLEYKMEGQVDLDDYFDVDGPTGLKRLCCLSTSPDLKVQRYRASGCHQTQCFEMDDDKASEDQICSSLPLRYINGKQINYKLAFRDNHECLNLQSHHYGILGYCCPENSEAGMLAAVLGAERHQFPYFVFLHMTSAAGNGNTCGAAIYNDRYLITAAHCVLSEGNMAKVDQSYAFTDVRVQNMMANPNFHFLEKFIPHPNATQWKKKSEAGMVVNDIAIVKLKDPLTFGPNVLALPPAEKGFDPFLYADESIQAGLGTTDIKTSPGILFKGRPALRNLDIDAQNKILWGSSFEKVPKGSVLFIGGKLNGTSSIELGAGDSGSPAVCKNSKGQPVHCGVLSTSSLSTAETIDQCKKSGSEEDCRPSTFMAVQHHRDWITEIAGQPEKKNIFKEYMYGAPVPSGMYDHQVRITSKGGPSCGGTLIEKDLVVTAAHCVKDDNGNDMDGLKVISGIRDLKSDKGVEHSVVKADTPTGFHRVDTGGRKKRIIKLDLAPTPQNPLYNDDIALVRISDPVDISSSKLPKIGKAPSTDGDTGDVTWTTEVSLPLDTKWSGKLQQRDFQILSSTTCQRRIDRASYGKAPMKIDRKMICGQEKYNGGAQCDRELGGGLICKGNVLCGVQTFRFCQLSLPSAFLDISQYQDWIRAAKEWL